MLGLDPEVKAYFDAILSPHAFVFGRDSLATSLISTECPREGTNMCMKDKEILEKIKADATDRLKEIEPDRNCQLANIKHASARLVAVEKDIEYLESVVEWVDKMIENYGDE